MKSKLFPQCKLKDRITPHVTNFFRLGLSIEKQEGKRKYKSDGVWMSEWVNGWVSEWVRVSESEWEWVRGSEREWEGVSGWVSGPSAIDQHHDLSRQVRIKTPICQACHAKEAEPKGRQGVHPTPWQYTLSHACHAKCTLSHACHAKEAEPKARQGVHPTPWQCTLSHACHAKEAEPKIRQGVHPTPWQCTLSHACHAKEAEPKGRYIRPLGNAHCPTPATQKRRSPRDARAYIRPLGSAHCPTPATQKRRSPRDARAYIRPLAVHIVPRLPRKRDEWVSECEWVSVPATQKRRSPRDARAYIRPLGSAHCPTPATQKRWVSESVSVSECECVSYSTRFPKGEPGTCERLRVIKTWRKTTIWGGEQKFVGDATWDQNANTKNRCHIDKNRSLPREPHITLKHVHVSHW